MPSISLGEKILAFELPDENGNRWNSVEQFAQGPVVLVFYRGDW